MDLVIQDVVDEGCGECVRAVASVSPSELGAGAGLGVTQQPAASIRFFDDDKGLIVRRLQADIGPVSAARCCEQRLCGLADGSGSRCGGYHASHGQVL